MANFLEDYDKSGAAGSFQRFAGQAVDLAKTNLSGSRDMLGTAIDLEKLSIQQRDQALQEEKHKSDMEIAKKDARIKEEEARQAEAKGRFLRGRVNPTVDPRFQELPQETKDQLMAEWKANGELDAEGTISRQGALDTLDMLNTNAEKFDTLVRRPKIKAADNAAAEAYAALQAEREKPKPNPDKIKELEANAKLKAQEANVLRGKVDGILEDVKREEDWRRTVEKIKMMGKNALDRVKAQGQARQKAVDDITKWMKGLASAQRAKVMLKGSGGIDPLLMGILAKDNPSMASALQGADKGAAIAAVDMLIKRYETLLGSDTIKAYSGDLKPDSEQESYKDYLE